MTRYVLPDLPYDYGALEPFISGEIVALHHDKHHRAYVDGANKAIEKLLDMRHEDNFDSIAAVQKMLAFNVSGHVLHSLYWKNMRPNGGGEPTGELASAIAQDFGCVRAFFRQAALRIGYEQLSFKFFPRQLRMLPRQPAHGPAQRNRNCPKERDAQLFARLPQKESCLRRR